METLSDLQWQIAHNMAIELVKSNTDRNELGKVIAYLRYYSDRSDVGTQFFRYLTTLAKQGEAIGHSGKTPGYYQNIESVCQEYLQEYQNDVGLLLGILGWVRRLMVYYKDGGMPIEELSSEIGSVEISNKSERQLQIAEALSQKSVEVGQVVEAKVVNIKGTKVAYEIKITTQRLTQKEPKKSNTVTEGQEVKVEIVTLKDDGSIKKVKLL